MAASVVNLRLARKAAKRAARRAEAAENAARSGQTASERDLAAARAGQLSRKLDAHRLEGRNGDRAGRDGPEA